MASDSLELSTSGHTTSNFRAPAHQGITAFSSIHRSALLLDIYINTTFPSNVTMRERITFVQKLGESLDPSVLKINGGVIDGPEIQAAREDRLTFAIEELPNELQSLLKGAHELHVRWVSPTSYEAVSPFLARLPPGFHVFFTPGKDKDGETTS